MRRRVTTLNPYARRVVTRRSIAWARSPRRARRRRAPRPGRPPRREARERRLVSQPRHESPSRARIREPHRLVEPTGRISHHEWEWGRLLKYTARARNRRARTSPGASASSSDGASHVRMPRLNHEVSPSRARVSGSPTSAGFAMTWHSMIWSLHHCAVTVARARPSRSPPPARRGGARRRGRRRRRRRRRRTRARPRRLGRRSAREINGRVAGSGRGAMVRQMVRQMGSIARERWSNGERGAPRPARATTIVLVSYRPSSPALATARYIRSPRAFTVAFKRCITSAFHLIATYVTSALQRALQRTLDWHYNARYICITSGTLQRTFDWHYNVRSICIPSLRYI